VLFDEIGAGTDPAEGAALAKSILLSLREQGAVIVASTHYGELKAFAYNTDGFRNAAMEFDLKTLRPTYKLLMGAPGASHALRIAERYGLPRAVVERAKEGLSDEHVEMSAMMEKLETAQRQARIAQGEADRRLADLRAMEKRAAEKLAEAEQIRKNVHAKAQETIDEALRQLRSEAAQLFEELKNAPRDMRQEEEVRRKLKALQEYGSSVSSQFKQPAQKRGKEPLRKGMDVKIGSFGQVGVLLSDPAEETATVQVGSLKMTVATSDLSPVQPKDAPKAKPKVNLSFQKAQTAGTEIHLRAMRAEEAMDALERFLDDAVLAGVPQVRIVHGKGEGILRKLTQEFLRKYPHVDHYRDAEAGEGGHGVTVASIK
jgi:DNA mismatch repair protein MutS2